MTKKQALNQSLSDEDCGDWLIPDFLNLEVVDDVGLDSPPILVKNLSVVQAQVGLGIAINYIKKQNKKLEKIKKLL